MNFLAFFKTLNFENARERCVQRSRPDAQWHAVVVLSALLFAICTHDLPAQVGDNNPGGHSGIFNGQINTGCSYDPYTGNATRSITDISVAGAVGEYPLALVRTANSRALSTTEVFAFAGGWNHNYNWIMEESEPAKRKFSSCQLHSRVPGRQGGNLQASELGHELLSGKSEQRRRGQLSGRA